MMRKYALIAVEGNHDQALIEKVLRKILGFKKFSGNEQDLDQFWQKFVPQYPPKQGKLYVRLDMPTILLKDTLSVAIYAGGGSNLSINLEDTPLLSLSEKLKLFGIVECRQGRRSRHFFCISIPKSMHMGKNEIAT
ncbi:MAG: hypothetical protein J7545_11375, partial [Roseofilum sp. SBFL]|nr:hypothetical protein [Roseofilum sp. SBFL]